MQNKVKSILDYSKIDCKFNLRCGGMDKSIYSEAYAEFLRQLRASRHAKGLTQEELAARLGTTQSFVSKCERGERRIDLVETRAFCEALKLDFLEFVTVVHKCLPGGCQRDERANHQ